jgi:hypothetical protein
MESDRVRNREERWRSTEGKETKEVTEVRDRGSYRGKRQGKLQREETAKETVVKRQKGRERGEILRGRNQM